MFLVFSWLAATTAVTGSTHRYTAFYSRHSQIEGLNLFEKSVLSVMEMELTAIIKTATSGLMTTETRVYKTLAAVGLPGVL